VSGNIDVRRLSGMLLRSEIVRRWPTLRVAAFARADGGKGSRMGVSKPVLVADSVMLVVFGGVPERVEVTEPDEGTRFGVTLPSLPAPPTSDPSANVRAKEGGLQVTAGGDPVQVLARYRKGAAPGVLDITALAGNLQQKLGGTIGSSALSLCLQKTPYTQTFVNTQAEMQESLADLNPRGQFWKGAQP
jgi:hypothetical protein